MPKARRATEVVRFQDIPNIGPAMAKDFGLLGIKDPRDLAKADPMALYRALCEATCTRHDPCVLDTFLAACDFMNGAPALPWWHYTASRKERWPQV